MRPHPFSRYPCLTLLALTGLLLAGLTGYAMQRGKQLTMTQAEQELIARTEIAQGQAASLLQRNDIAGLAAFCASVAATTNTRITVLRPDGTVMADSHENPTRMDNHAGRPEIVAALEGRIAPTRHYSYTLQTEMLYVAVPLKHNTTLLGVLRTALPTADLERRFIPLRREIMLLAALFFVLTSVTAWRLNRSLSRSLQAMRQWAEDLTIGKPPRKLAPAGPDAVAALAIALNRLASEVTEQISRISQQRNELEAVFGSMIEGVLTVDAEERIQSFNPSALALLGLDPRKVKGRSTLEAVRNLELQRFIRTTLTDGAIHESEITLPDAAGANRAFYLRGVPLRDAGEQTIGALVVLGDVTNLRRLETVRRDFVANVSHELKTPITSISGFVETLLDGALEEPDNARRFLEIIRQQAKRLHAIIEDLLALSRLEKESERNEIALTRHALRESFAAAVQTCQSAATAKGMTIKQECPETIVASLNAPLFEQALVNLIDNAIKYSPAGSNVLVTAAAAAGEVVVSVQDHGVGIAPRDQARIFERFFRVDKARSSTMGGTGLGLSIVKHIIQAHGGRITLTSTPGQGSTFSLHLPAERA